MKRSNAVSTRIALGLLAAALAAPAAQAAARPDDRAGTLGVGPVLASQPSLRPDDRPGIRGIGETKPATPSPVELIIAQERARHADPSLFGPSGLAPAQSFEGRGGFDWGDAGIGVISGFGLALALTGGLFLVLRRIPLPHRTGSAPTG